MEILLTLKNYRCFEDTTPAQFVVRNGFISFIGVNNAGKSSLLKFFYEFRGVFRLLSNPSGNLIEAIIGNGSLNSFSFPVKDDTEIFCNLNQRDLEFSIEFEREKFDRSNHEVAMPKKIVFTFSRIGAWRVDLIMDTNEKFTPKDRQLGFKQSILIRGDKPLIDLSHMFEVFELLTRMLYIPSFRNAINQGENTDDVFDIKTGHALIRKWRKMKTGDRITDNEATIRVTNEIKRVFGFDTLEINPGDANADLKIFIDGRSYKLTELGAGLAQFIIVLANVAISQPTFILIDEPELSLHPKLQLDLLRALGVYATEGVLFATHSIGLARASSTQIYSIRIDKNNKRKVLELDLLPSLAEFLGEIGFSAYRELGFDKLLLVEGSHDITTMQEFLRMKQKEHEYVLLPLGGGSLINADSEAQLMEIQRITSNISILIDSERSSEGAPLSQNVQGFVRVCSKLNIPCHVLERRALENYLSDDAVKKIKGEQFSPLGAYEKLSSKNGWGKSENWKIARHMKLSDLNDTDLGKFVDSL